ncbi:MAG: class I adenylate-forming enzyme family protein [Candidatus Helarchaeota archaeon]
MSYGQLLTDLAKKFGDVEIVKHGNRISTLRELENRANQVAHALLNLGVQNGEKYGIMLYNSPEYLEIMFGLQKINAIPVPINIRFGFTEFKYIFKNSDMVGLFLDEEFFNKIRFFIEKEKYNQIPHLIIVSRSPTDVFDKAINYETLIHDKDVNVLTMEIADDDVALLLYTGGTTGLPKGVVLTHSNLYNATYIVPKHGMNLIMSNKIHAEAMIPSGGKKIKFLTPTPIYHVSGLMPVLTQVGLRNLLLFPESRTFNPEEICQIIEKEEVTTIFMVPTMYRIWLNYDLEKYDLSSLTLISSGGAKLPLRMKIELLERFPNVTLVDGYGSTETLGTSTVAFMSHEDIPKIKKGYIGQVVTGIKMRIVNKLGEDVPTGEVGEMIYKGKTIMQGYYKDNSKTEAIFDREGWLHSGDLCKMDEKGNIYYVGRMSEMITSGGEKIYPMEIEDVLRSHPKIQDVAITGIPDKIWGQKVVAFIELERHQEMTVPDVIDYCKDKIASYKKPRIVQFIEKLPLTKSGKINRNQVRKMASSLIVEEKT